MRPKKLILCGWGPYKDKQEIDFEVFGGKGIFLITGATGAGKTTIFDAITYALYGALSGDERDKERNSVRSDFATLQMPTYVELVMEHGGAVYRIVRNPEYMRPKKRGKADAVTLTKEKENAILYYEDGRVLEGVREVNSTLQELLVLDYQQYKKISMIAQGEFARLLVAPPKEKTKIFREIFGTGVYERFTANLGNRARKLYAKVMEQKHKLEEDIRLLAVGEEDAELTELILAEYWNYEQIEEYLQNAEKKAAGFVAQERKEYEKAEQKVEKLTGVLVKEEEENKKLEQFWKISKEREILTAKKQEYEDKEGVYKKAVNAGFAEAADQAVRQLSKQLLDIQEEIEQAQLSLQQYKAESLQLEGIVKLADKIRALLDQAKQLQENESAFKLLEQEIVQQRVCLEDGQRQYLQQQQEYGLLKQQYEREDHRRKLSVIGLAAEFLVEGMPCPVCGSITHPNPAQLDVELVSEEELEHLKERAEKEEGVLQQLHENLVTVKTRLDGKQNQWELVRKQIEEIKQQLEKEQEEQCRSYLSMEPDKASNLLNRNCERASALVELIGEKERQIKKMSERQQELERKQQEAVDAFEQTLQTYGFANAQEYKQARLEKEVRELLRKELEDYRARVSANEELYQHLKTAVQRKEPVALEELRQQLLEAKNNKENALKVQKKWESRLSEIQKTTKAVREKRKEMDKASDEYGYVKDLENMAMGNNARKLVFEQYVLAGYFEEILRAANLRFQKMTSGRYEMSRIGEVGDGRVKDNLEIQVMDYYTGKYRSVRTLSGGESFKASLSLALGMSDVIQSMNGGVRVDTLFVDEGFGALDEESLDQACDSLMGLAERNCLIGIISHVPELRERIQKQLIIDKTSSGSVIHTKV